MNYSRNERLGEARSMPWTLAFLDGRKPVEALYSGPLVKELPYGIGTFVLSTGDLYIGEVVWGAMHGSGTYWSKRYGQVRRGIFENNLYLGQQKNFKVPKDQLQ